MAHREERRGSVGRKGERLNFITPSKTLYKGERERGGETETETERQRQRRRQTDRA